MKKNKVILAVVVLFLGALLAFWKKKTVEVGNTFAQKNIKKDQEISSFTNNREPINDPNERVRIALEKFKIEQAKIPDGAAIEQLAAIKEKTAELAKIETPLPLITEEVDGSGLKWKRLAYPSGEVRYELAE